MRFIMLLSLSSLLISPLSAYARIYDYQSPDTNQQQPAPAQKHPTQKEYQKAPVNPFPTATQNLKKHTLVLSTAFRALDVQDFTYGNFNNQAIQNIDSDKINKTAFDFGFSYHYRPEPAYSLGFAFDRLQITQTNIDLRYSSTDLVPPDPTTLAPIASDLVSNDDLYAVAYYYQPVKCGNRGYAYEIVTRGYFLPNLSFDPFAQITIGWTHNRAAVYRADGSVNISPNDQNWTWSIGTGCKYYLYPNLAFEFLGMIRNQQGWAYSDQISSATQNTTYSFTVKSSRYYSADLKISLCQVW
ncbi:MAG: hypothetical protein FJ161_03670 [Gammaproteobacteria bacterium]|nr:hypothetical protein [Gammaproteobacteria bacterium]